MSRSEALDRTFLLARQLLGTGAESDEEVDRALAATTVAVVSDERNLRSRAALYAVATLSWMCVAQGCQLRLVLPRTSLPDSIPPLRARELADGVLNLEQDLDQGAGVMLDTTIRRGDLVFVLGDTDLPHVSSSTIWRLAAGRWWGATREGNAQVNCWTDAFPVGGGIAAAIAAAEPFKAAVAKAAQVLKRRPPVRELLEPTAAAEVRLTTSDGPERHEIGKFDVISAGAISNAVMQVILNVPKAAGLARVIDDERLEVSNLNRYALGSSPSLREYKADTVATWATDDLQIIPVRQRLTRESVASLKPFADRVLVGADSVPARWLAQELMPMWLGVGATSDFMTLTSSHLRNESCAGCLHPIDDEVNLPIPTVSFVSYWAGLLLAARLLGWNRVVAADQQALMLWPLRLDLRNSMVWMPVLRNPACPIEAAHG